MGKIYWPNRAISSPIKGFYAGLFIAVIYKMYLNLSFVTKDSLILSSGAFVNEYQGDVFIWFLRAFVLLTMIHFMRIYSYLHNLENSNSDDFTDIIKPIKNSSIKGYDLSGFMLRFEFFLRLIIIGIVSLKLISLEIIPYFEPIHNPTDVLEFACAFSIYLIVLYSLLIFYDIVLLISKKDFFATYLYQNAVGIFSMIWFHNSISSADNQQGYYEMIIPGVFFIATFVPSLFIQKRAFKGTVNAIVMPFLEILPVKRPNYQFIFEKLRYLAFRRNGYNYSGNCSKKSCIYKEADKPIYKRTHEGI